MIPVLSPSEMTAVDRSATEPVEVLVRRAAGAVARAALSVLGGGYAKRVVVVAGPGNNGWDGRVAAGILARRGVRTVVIDTTDSPSALPEADLVIDAAFGTGFRGEYRFPRTDAPVLAVDIPSGVDGLTGEAAGLPAGAMATVTFAALKPGLLLGDGPSYVGEMRLADIGLDVSSASMFMVTDGDLLDWVPRRPPTAHKWTRAVWLVAGSPEMQGAAALAAAAAMRGGAGYLRLSTPGVDRPGAPLEAVLHPLPAHGWARSVIDGADRFGAVAVGPGLGRSEGAVHEIGGLLESLDRPLVLDGDALWAVAQMGSEADALMRRRAAATVLTPHDGEYETLVGYRPGADRVAAARGLAARTGATVLLKGSTTVVSDPDGQVLFACAGDQRLATAGTGDVLSGLVAAHLAAGAAPGRAAASAAHLHGRAGGLGPERGLVASDLVDLIPRAWESISNA